MRMRREMTPLERLLKRALLSILARNLYVSVSDWSRQPPREKLVLRAILASLKSFDMSISMYSFVHGERLEYRSKTDDIKTG